MECNVNIEAGIENCGGSEEFYIEIIEAYEEEGKKFELIKAFENKDWELYTIEVHGLKGTMNLLGATDAGKLAEKLQFAGEKKEIETIERFHALLIEMIDSSVATIKQKMNMV